MSNPTPLERVRPELTTIAESDHVPIRLDVSDASRVAIGAVPRLAELRPLVVARFGEAVAARLDAVELHASAANEAHVAYLALGTDADVAPLFREVTEKKQLLLTEIDSLVARGHLDRHVLRRLKGGNAFADRALDTQQAVAVLRAHWPRIEAHTPITRADVDAADAVATAFTQALATREHGEKNELETTRAAAWTLFFRTWSAVRRVVVFLRWAEGDADTIAPSLYSGRATPRRDRIEAPPAAPAAPTGPATPGLPNSNPFPNG